MVYFAVNLTTNINISCTYASLHYLLWIWPIFMDKFTKLKKICVFIQNMCPRPLFMQLFLIILWLKVEKSLVVHNFCLSEPKMWIKARIYG